jgi:hypothetical protein
MAWWESTTEIEQMLEVAWPVDCKYVILEIIYNTFLKINIINHNLDIFMKCLKYNYVKIYSYGH